MNVIWKYGKIVKHLSNWKVESGCFILKFYMKF